MKRTKRRFTAEEKLEIIKARENNGLTLQEVSKVMGVNDSTIWKWNKLYKEGGLKALKDRTTLPPEWKRKPKLIEAKILVLKRENPKMGSKKISDQLLRFDFLKVCAETVRKILRKNKVQPVKMVKRKRQPNKRFKRFERSLPNQLWQIDIFTWMLRGIHRVYVIAVLDDCSRFIVGWELFHSQGANNVLEVVKGAIEKYGYPEEILSDNGRQFVNWRGKTKFQKTLVKLGIEHIKSSPHKPTTLGKIEAFWRNLWRELLSEVAISSFEEAKRAISNWIEKYNYKRVHQGLREDGQQFAPADKYFGTKKVVSQAVSEGITEIENFLKEHPEAYPSPVYLTGKIGGKEILIRAKEGEIKIEGAEKVGQAKEIGIKSESKEVCSNEPKSESNSINTEGDSIDERDERKRRCEQNLSRTGDPAISVLQMEKESDSSIRGSFSAPEERSSQERRDEESQGDAGENSSVSRKEPDNEKGTQSIEQKETKVGEYDGNSQKDNILSGETQDTTQGDTQ